MIYIKNISNKRWAISTYAFNGSNNVPLIIDPETKSSSNNFVYIMKDNLKKYGSGVKQTIADAVATGIIEVVEVDSVHVGVDKSPEIKIRGGAYGLQGLYDTANEFKADFNRHIVSMVHIAQGATFITAANATTLPTLIALITDAQTQYNTHIPLVALHPNADVTNATPAIAPVDAVTCVVRLKEVLGFYKQHKKFSYVSGALPLTPVQIITY